MSLLGPPIQGWCGLLRGMVDGTGEILEKVKRGSDVPLSPW